MASRLHARLSSCLPAEHVLLRGHVSVCMCPCVCEILCRYQRPASELPQFLSTLMFEIGSQFCLSLPGLELHTRHSAQLFYIDVGDQTDVITLVKQALEQPSHFPGPESILFALLVPRLPVGHRCPIRSIISPVICNRKRSQFEIHAT